jgi:hypothetical protein
MSNERAKPGRWLFGKARRQRAWANSSRFLFHPSVFSLSKGAPFMHVAAGVGGWCVVLRARQAGRDLSNLLDKQGRMRCWLLEQT